MKIKFGIVVFPGSNCDHDAYYSLKNILNQNVEFLWHKDSELKNSDVIILPGGFSYGDYLRTGAIATLSPILDKVINFANSGGVVIGICNGFQILTEAGLLEGVLLKNNSLKFVCRNVYISVVNKNTRFTNQIKEKFVLKIPVAHGDGNFFAEQNTLLELEKNNQIVFKYSSKENEIDNSNNPNGSLNNIAGIMNKKGNVLGMMPHPERCCNPILGNIDGQLIFKSIIYNFLN